MTRSAAPARPIAAVEGGLRGRRSPIAWLLAPAPAARLALLRILVGAYARAWAAIRLPAHLGHADQVADRWRAVGVLAPLGSPPADVAIVLLAAAAPVLGLLIVAGWRYGAVHHEDLDDPREPTDSDGRYGWPVRLAAVAVVLAYVLAGIAKLRIGGLRLVHWGHPRPPLAHHKPRQA